jgi:hypothetical protein
MSNTTQEFCAASSTTTGCSSWSFMGQAAADAAVNHAALAIVNGARGGQDAQTWDAPTDANYDSVRLNRLGPLGLTERRRRLRSAGSSWKGLARNAPTRQYSCQPHSKGEQRILPPRQRASYHGTPSGRHSRPPVRKVCKSCARSALLGAPGSMWPRHYNMESSKGLSHSPPIQAPILNRFAYVFGLQLRRTFQIGDRARDLEDPVVRPGREPEPRDQRLE